MKRHNGKPKPEAGTGFDEAGSLEPAIGFDYASLYAADEGVDADTVSHGLTRDEAEAWLLGQGLSQPDRALVIGRVFDKATVRKLEAETGWKKSRVAQRLKSPTIWQAIADLRSGKALSPGKGVVAVAVPKFRTLPVCATHARALYQSQGLNAAEEMIRIRDTRKPRRTFTVGVTVAKALLRSRVLNSRRGNPIRLLDSRQPRCGRGRKSTKADVVLAKIVDVFYQRIAELQREWRATRRRTPTTATRDAVLEKFREIHRKEFRGMKTPKLRALLTCDPVDQAARLAEIATGLSAEAFLRASRYYPPASWKSKFRRLRAFAVYESRRRRKQTRQ